jgi:hypothetical protein
VNVNGALIDQLDFEKQQGPTDIDGVYGTYDVSEDEARVSLRLPSGQVPVGITVEEVGSTSSVSFSSCADVPDQPTARFSFSALTPSIPLDWKGEGFAHYDCDPFGQGDEVTGYTLNLTTVTDSRITGAFGMTVAGSGARAGDTLEVSGSVDMTLTSE